MSERRMTTNLIIDLYYVDDDNDDIEIFTDAVNQISDEHSAKIVLHTYKDGDRLLSDIIGCAPANSVVFLDINMPQKNGYEVLKDIRQNPALQSMPVIMYSTSTNKDAVKESLALGASLYAVKPTSFSKLKAIIKHVIDIDWANFNLDPADFLLA